MSFTFICEKYSNVEEFLQHCKLESSGKTREVVDDQNNTVEFGFLLENCKIVSVSKEYGKAAIEITSDARAALRNIKTNVFDECEPFLNGGVFGFKIPENEQTSFAERFKKNMYVKAQFSFKSAVTFQGTMYVTFKLERICETEAPFTTKKSIYDW